MITKIFLLVAGFAIGVLMSNIAMAINDKKRAERTINRMKEKTIHQRAQDYEAESKRQIAEVYGEGMRRVLKEAKDIINRK